MKDDGEGVQDMISQTNDEDSIKLGRRRGQRANTKHEHFLRHNKKRNGPLESSQGQN